MYSKFLTIFLLLSLSANTLSQPKSAKIHHLQTQNQEPTVTQLNTTEVSTPTNESYVQCLERAVGYTAVATALGSGAAAVGGTAALSAVGFTSGGVAVGSVAAGVQSAITVVEAGSMFAYFQSAGALVTGVFGAAFLPVTIGVGVVAGSGYLYSQCGLPF